MCMQSSNDSKRCDESQPTPITRVKIRVLIYSRDFSLDLRLVAHGFCSSLTPPTPVHFMPDSDLCGIAAEYTLFLL
jgi:hypothetical protein